MAAERRGELGGFGFGDEGAPLTIVEVVALGPKCYSEYLCDSRQYFHKFKAKGFAKQHRNLLEHESYRRAWMDGRPGAAVTSYHFQSRNHVVNLVEVQRLGLTAFTDKVYQVSRLHSRPHGHFRNLTEPFRSLCLLLPPALVDYVYSFLGPGGYLCLEAARRDRRGSDQRAGVLPPILKSVCSEFKA